MATQYKDRFSEAEEELSEKSAYICTSCNTFYGKEKAKKQADAAGQSRNWCRWNLPLTWGVAGNVDLSVDKVVGPQLFRAET